MPSLLKESLGLVVVLLSMKFNEAQNCPDNAWVRPDQLSWTLKWKGDLLINNIFKIIIIFQLIELQESMSIE